MKHIKKWGCLFCAALLFLTGCGKAEVPVRSDEELQTQIESQTEAQTETPSPEEQPIESETADRVQDQIPSDPQNWGLTLSARKITPTGMTLVITQSGGAPTGELDFGSEYDLEKKTADGWEPVPYAAEGVIAWTQVAYLVTMEGETEQEISWEYLYGSLDKGEYRLNKKFSDFRGTGDYDTAVYSVTFEI